MSRLSSWSAEQIASRLSRPGRGRARPTAGGGWMACCPAHDDRTPSLSLKNTQDGMLLYHCFGGCDPDSVKEELERAIGADPVEYASEEEKEKTKIEDPRKAVIPVPEDAPITVETFHHHIHGSPSKVWTYRLPGGRTAAWVARYDTGEGEKEVIPYIWTRHEHSGKEESRAHAMPNPRSLYNLDRIAADIYATVVYCEGEKAADAADALFPDWIPTTNQGGSNALGTCDLTPLHGRRVVIFPDLDGPGYELALKISDALIDECDLHIIMWPDFWPMEDGQKTPYVFSKGDDAADHLQAGWTRDKLHMAIEDGHRLIHRMGRLPEEFEVNVYLDR